MPVTQAILWGTWQPTGQLSYSFPFAGTCVDVYLACVAIIQVTPITIKTGEQEEYGRALLAVAKVTPFWLLQHSLIALAVLLPHGISSATKQTLEGGKKVGEG